MNVVSKSISEFHLIFKEIEMASYTETTFFSQGIWTSDSADQQKLIFQKAQLYISQSSQKTALRDLIKDD